MAKHYQTLDPLKYYRDYVKNDLRPDGREFMNFRPAVINVRSIDTADGSSIIKIGNTTVICGVKAELAQPKPDAPDKGFMIPNVELPPLCSSKFKPGPPSDQAQVTTQMINNIFETAGCLDLSDLCIQPEKLSWVLYCDMICLDYDGAIIDACLIALLSALTTVTLPEVTYDAAAENPIVNLSHRRPLNVRATPVATTFAVFDDHILLADPTNEEETLSTGLVTIVYENGELNSIHKPGGSPLSKEEIQKCLEESATRSNLILKLINAAMYEREK